MREHTRLGSIEDLRSSAEAVMAQYDEETTGSTSLDNLINAAMAHECEANADLLAACEALVAGVEDAVLRFLDSHDQQLRPDMDRILRARVDRARAAIARAKGATP